MKKHPLLKSVVLSLTGTFLVMSSMSCGVLKREDLCLGDSCLVSNSPALLTVTGTSDYGDLPVGGSKNVTLTISNSGDSSAVLGTVSTAGLGLTGAFTLLGGTCSTLGSVAAKGSCTLVLTFSPSSLGATSKNLSLTYNDSSAAQTTEGSLTGRGVVPGSLTFSDGPSYTFPNTTINATSPAKSFTVTNIGQAPVILGTVSASAMGLPSVFSVAGGTCQTGGTVAPSSSCTINLTFNPTVAIQTTSTIVLVYSDGVGERIATRSIAGTGLTLGTLVFSDTPTFDYNNVINSILAGTTSTGHVFHLTNTGQSPVTLGTINNLSLGLQAPFTLNTGASTCVTGGTVAGGSNCTLKVAFAPTTYTTSTSTMTVAYTGGTAPSASVDIQGTGAHPGVMTLSPATTSTYQFGTVERGGSKTLTLTVTNSGVSPAAPIEFTDLSSTGLGLSAPFSASGGTCSTSTPLVMNASCTVLVTYNPTVVGGDSGSLQIPFNPGTGDTLSTALNFDANSLDPGVLSISDGPGTYAFGNVLLPGDPDWSVSHPTPTGSIVKTFTVTNTGLPVWLLSLGTTQLGLSGPFILTGGTCQSDLLLASSGTCTLVVTYEPSSSYLGTTTQSISLSYFDGVGTQTASRGVSGIAQNVANLEFEDSSNYTSGETYYDYGLVVNPSGPTHTFTIKNNGGTNATLGTITTAGLGLSGPFSLVGGGSCATGGTLAPDATCTVVIRFLTATGTTYTQNLTFHYNDGNNTDQTVSTELRGQNYVPGVLTFDDGSSYDYGTIWTYNSPSKSFTIRNTGSVSVTIDKLTDQNLNLSYPFNYSGSNCWESTLAPNATCVLIIYFYPFGAATYNRAVSVSFHDGNQSNTVGINLTGIAVQPGYFTQIYDYGTVSAGSTKLATFHLTNNGGYSGTITTPLSTAGLGLTGPLSYAGGTCANLTTYNVGSSCTIDILFTPTGDQTGTQSIGVNFRSVLPNNDEEDRALGFTVKYTGTGGV